MTPSEITVKLLISEAVMGAAPETGEILMGAAAYNRGSKLISEQITAEQRPVEFEIMDRLNAIPKANDAGTPFTDIRFSFSHGGWWALCPKTGFGYWYSSLHQAVHHWNVTVIGYDSGDWIATL